MTKAKQRLNALGIALGVALFCWGPLELAVHFSSQPFPINLFRFFPVLSVFLTLSMIRGDTRNIIAGSSQTAARKFFLSQANRIRVLAIALASAYTLWFFSLVLIGFEATGATAALRQLSVWFGNDPKIVIIDRIMLFELMRFISIFLAKHIATGTFLLIITVWIRKHIRLWRV